MVENKLAVKDEIPVLEHFKTLYYLLNAKPDSQTKILKGSKLVQLVNIHDINHRVIEKLKNHDLETNITTINFILKEGIIYNYQSWQEFLNKNWDEVNQEVNHISINWDMNLKLPNYKLPQRHSLKLKIGDAIPPKDFFQLMFTSDDENEIMEGRADAVCKVDFINQVIATELLDIVEKWYVGLQDTESDTKLTSFLKKNEDNFERIIHTALPTLLLVLFLYYLPFLQKIDLFKDVNVSSLSYLFVIINVLFLVSVYFSKGFSKFLTKKILSFKKYSPFLISRGDSNHHLKIEKENKGILKEIKIKLLVSFITLIITVALKWIIDFLSKQ